MRVEFPTAASARTAGVMKQKGEIDEACGGIINSGESVMNGAEAVRSFWTLLF